MKDSYVDVKAVLSNQSKVIVEMQVLNVEGFEKRVLYNAAKLYSTQLKKSGKYTTLEPIIALTLTDFEMFPEFAKTISYWNLREREVLLQYSNDIELIFAELPKFTKTEAELSSITDKWLYFVKHAGDLEFVPESFTEPQLLEAFDIANTAGLSEEELDIQFKRQDFIAMQQGALKRPLKMDWPVLPRALSKVLPRALNKVLKKGLNKGLSRESPKENWRRPEICCVIRFLWKRSVNIPGSTKR